MGWNGSGIFVRGYSWVQDDANGINITASRMDADTNDIANNGFGNTLTRDGQGGPTANLPMNNLRHTNVANGVARTDYAAMGQVQDSSPQDGGTSTGAAGVFAITLSPAITAYARGQKFSFITHQAAAGADTLNVNTVGATPFVKDNGTAIVANDFGSGQELLVMYDTGGGGRFILLNTPKTLAGYTLTNPTTTGGTLSSPTITTPTVTGGTFASPALIGSPTAPTPAFSDGSTLIATTAWVRGFVTSTINLPLAAAQPVLTFNSPLGT